MDPTSGDANASERIASTLELLAKGGGLLGMLWAFLAKVLKPWIEARRKARVTEIRDAIAPEVDKLNDLIEREEQCAERNEELHDRQQIFHERQQRIFGEFDQMLKILVDNRERINEQNDLLDQVFALDRRVDPDRRREIDVMLAELHQRRKDARRTED
jgi:hypothetical protein